jgi:hypothetical protein
MKIATSRHDPENACSGIDPGSPTFRKRSCVAFGFETPHEKAEEFHIGHDLVPGRPRVADVT